MNPAEIAMLLNALARVGVAWSEWGKLVDYARREKREVTAQDVERLAFEARASLDRLHEATRHRPAQSRVVLTSRDDLDNAD